MAGLCIIGMQVHSIRREHNKKKSKIEVMTGAQCTNSKSRNVFSSVSRQHVGVVTGIEKKMKI